MQAWLDASDSEILDNLASFEHGAHSSSVILPYLCSPAWTVLPVPKSLYMPVCKTQPISHLLHGQPSVPPCPTWNSSFSITLLNNNIPFSWGHVIMSWPHSKVISTYVCPLPSIKISLEGRKYLF